MNKTCQQCTKEFSKPYNCSKKEWVNRKLCSKECYLKWKPVVTLVCWGCKKEFQVRNYRKETAHFCSHECSSQYRDEGKRTADKKLRQSWAYKLWRKAVFIKDNFTCVNCGDRNYEGRGKTIVIQADHIKPFALNPELRFEVSNGRTLCVDCHKKTGTWGRGAIFRNHLASA